MPTSTSCALAASSTPWCDTTDVADAGNVAVGHRVEDRLQFSASRVFSANRVARSVALPTSFSAEFARPRALRAHVRVVDELRVGGGGGAIQFRHRGEANRAAERAFNTVSGVA